MSVRSKDIPLRRLKIVLLVSSLLSLALLLMAAFEENVGGEWRRHQAAYRAAAIAHAETDIEHAAAESMEISFAQAFLPDLDRIDRCITCHVGIDDPRQADAEHPLRAHRSGIFDHHPPDKFGCTVCHDGQGRAVTRDAAHGEVPHWPAPLRRGDAVYTSCGRCHYENDLYGAETDLYARGGPLHPLDETELASFVPGGASIARGKRLVLESGCLGCHKYRGRGGSLGPEITYVGDKTAHDFDFKHIQGERTVAQWLFEHFKRPDEVSPGTLMPDAQLSDEQARDLTAYMLSLHRKSMPAAYTPVPQRREGKPVGGERLYAMFCRACHGENGLGSTVRDPLIAAAADVPQPLMVPSLNHPDTLGVASDDYLHHVIANGRAGTNMIGWGLRDGGLRPEEIDRLIETIRSWQPPRPDETAIAAARGSPPAGRVLYRQNCAACHGPNGGGGIGTRLNSPGFLAVASDAFIAGTIIDGRPNTAMTSYRQFNSQQISDLIAYLRSWHSQRSDRAAVLALVDAEPRNTAVSVAIGRTLYAANCVTCHGSAGEGDLGPSLNTQEFLTLVGNDYLHETIAAGRPDTGMPAWKHLSNEDVASLIVFIRTWQQEESQTLPGDTIAGDWDAGRFLYAGLCASCHGNDAEGAVGPQLNNPVFLRTTSDAMLREWIAHGKAGTPMRPFLKGEQGTAELTWSQIDNLVAYLRSLERHPRVSTMRSPNGRPELGRVWYANMCAACHGPHGEGASGPALANPGFLHAASDGFLMATLAMGRDGTEMRPVKQGPQSILALSSDQVNDVIAYLRSWETEPPDDEIPHRFVIPWDLAHGRELYTSHCAGCHGIDGKAETDAPGLSAWAPALNNEEFLAAATDGFLQATIVRGRIGTAMRPFGHGTQGLVDLSMQDIDDIVAFIRRWSTQTPSPLTIPAERSVAGAEETTDAQTRADTTRGAAEVSSHDLIATGAHPVLKGDE